MAYLRSLRDSEEEEPKKKKSVKPSIAELINFGGDYEERSEGGVLVGKDTGKTVKQTGRTVYKTDEGDNVSELSTTFKYKGKWINIPSIIMGEELTDDELRELLDEGLIKPTSTHDKLEDAEKAAEEHSKSLEFNKGGTPMDEQMKMFGEGGLFDEGGQVDEESGNEVPIGGTKEGVRDDIPAMLSEGEFVFPEDVTRYHGLEKLMNLRQEAKMGLKKMEAMGQMGNSEEATIPDDLPFTMDDLLVVVTDEEEPKKKDDKPIKAQAGTFVPAQQNLANVGIMGTQQSIYQQPNTVQPAAPLTVPASSLVPANTAPVGGYTAPTVLAAPATGYSPLYATEPVPTVATEVDEPEFVPDVSSEYKPVKYINPTTGDTMMINEYQGNPVSAVPAGYIRHSDFIAQGGKETETTDTTTGTGVETAQVATGGRSTDDEKKETEKLFDTLKTGAEKNRIAEYNTLLEEGSSTDILDEYKKSKTGQAFSALLGPLSIPANLLLNREQKEIEKAYLAAAAREGIDPDVAKKNFDEINILSSVKDTATSFGKDFASNFTKQGLKDFYDDYDAKFDLQDYSELKGGNFTPVQGYIKGAEGNNLDARQQQHFDNAVRDGNKAIADHFELIARSNDARDDFAKENATDIKLAQQGDADALNRLKDAAGSKTYNGVSIGASSIETIVEYGGSVVSAVDDGRAEAGGTFKKAKVVDKVGVAGDKGSIKTATNSSPPPKQSSRKSDDKPSNLEKQMAATRKRAIEQADKNLSKNRPKGTTFRKSSGGRGFTGGFKKGGLMKGKK